MYIFVCEGGLKIPPFACRFNLIQIYEITMSDTDKKRLETKL